MKRAIVIGALGLTLLLLAWRASAQGGYDLSWWSVDGGGATSTVGDGYTLGGAVGQPDADLLSEGDYVLAGGFWAGGRAAQRYLYLPLVLRGF